MKTKNIYTSFGDRFWEIDFLRGLAVWGMIAFHLFYLLDWYEITSYSLFSGGWKFFGDIVRNTFFLLVGISLFLSWQKSKYSKAFYLRHTKRAFLLLFLGAGVTFLSMIFTPDRIIFFGVLSFIGLGILLVMPFIRWAWTLFLCGAGILLVHIYGDNFFTTDSLWGYIIGTSPQYWIRSDYFPLIPWLAAIFWGGLLGHFLFPQGKRTYLFPLSPPNILSPFLWSGRNALWVYVLHFPVLFVMVRIMLSFLKK
ncbi:DUF1624 domain-containing protein [Candidatus Gracilibacteria bacterium]|nr:DUF1624 domain-containing protein [Candidatus Gracilibacteria bacterium]MCF7819250.1 DUF1624 domain-containing protein [Candidatus Gracilibacteria bacterium]